jgi:hypothetical protein
VREQIDREKWRKRDAEAEEGWRQIDKEAAWRAWRGRGKGENAAGTRTCYEYDQSYQKKDREEFLAWAKWYAADKNRGGALDQLLEITTRYCTYHLQEKFSDAVNAAFKAMTDTTVCREPSMVCPWEPQAQKTKSYLIECGAIKDTSLPSKRDKDDPVYKIVMRLVTEGSSGFDLAPIHITVRGKKYNRLEQYHPDFRTSANDDGIQWVGSKGNRTMRGYFYWGNSTKPMMYTEELFENNKPTNTMSSFCHIEPSEAAVSRANQTNCRVMDPTGTPLNVRTPPNGHIVGTLNNGDQVTVLDRTSGLRGKTWVYVGNYENNKPIGWVFREFIVCSGVQAGPPKPLTAYVPRSDFTPYLELPECDKTKLLTSTQTCRVTP